MAILPKPHRTEVIYALSISAALGAVGAVLLGSLFLWGPLVQTLAVESVEGISLYFLVYVPVVLLACVAAGVATGVGSVMMGFWLWEEED